MVIRSRRIHLHDDQLPVCSLGPSEHMHVGERRHCPARRGEAAVKVQARWRTTEQVEVHAW